MPGIVLDGWEMRDSKLIVPDSPGIGFDLEPEVVEKGTRGEDGFSVSV